MLLVAAETSYLTYQNLRGSRVVIQSHSILLDTSVLIDGRIESIARSGLVTAPLVIPRSVVRELQYMADKADHEKRERARFGLDMIEKLQNIDEVVVKVIEDGPLKEGGVDEQLVKLAKSYDARLCTTDYNLNKAARVQGVTVLNINEIAHALRIVRLPGEQVTIYLQQPGQERDQAVGHLDDGTMVVVDNGKALIGTEVAVEVTRALQTVAGKMLFAKLVGKPQSKAKQQPQAKPQPQPNLQQKQQPKPQPQTKNPRTVQPRQQGGAVNRHVQQAVDSTASQAQRQAPKKSNRRRKSMTDQAEDSLVNLLNKQ
jgi:rRNA-processing protein FCF1